MLEEALIEYSSDQTSYFVDKIAKFHKGNKIIEATEYATQVGKPAPVALNAAKCQTIPAFREKGVWKIGA